MRAKLKAIKQELRQRMHQSIPVQGKWLAQVVKGYFNFHAVPTNSHALGVFRHRVTELWRRVLQHRSHKAEMTWERMRKLANDWMSRLRVLHPWPSERFAVRHPRWEPYARIGRARFCAGGRSVMGVPTATGESI
jgi:RNA-directed DNA polymerase